MGNQVACHNLTTLTVFKNPFYFFLLQDICAYTEGLHVIRIFILFNFSQITEKFVYEHLLCEIVHLAPLIVFVLESLYQSNWLVKLSPVQPRLF